MTAVFVLILVAAAIYVLACMAVGLTPYGGTLSTFCGSIGPLQRRFNEPPDSVVSAYRSAISATPGMTLIEDDGQAGLLVDMRPTIRVLGGIYGLAIRVRAASDGNQTTVVVDGSPKVSFALTGDHQNLAALVHAERAIRMKAKKAGIAELV